MKDPSTRTGYPNQTWGIPTYKATSDWKTPTLWYTEPMVDAEIFIKCSFDNCRGFGYLGGYCPTHYSQLYKGNELSEIGSSYFKPETVCSVEECGNIRWSGGMCRGHYLQRHRGNPLQPVKQHPWTVCSIEGCKRGAITKGFCTGHYARSIRLKQTARRCSVDGCDRPHDARGFCKSHWAQWKRGEDPHELREWGVYNQTQSVKCAVASCNKPTISKQLCTDHASRAASFSLSTDEVVELLGRGKCDACGETNRLCIDHDHSCCNKNGSCGKCVRGLLCTWCNATLGHAKDDVSRLEKLIEYLRQTGTIRDGV